MTAATADRNSRTQLTSERIWQHHDVAASTIIYAGTIVVADANARAIPAAAVTSGDAPYRCLGLAEEQCDNSSGAAAAKEIEVTENAIALFVNGDSIAATDVGKPAYAMDDQTVTKSNGGTAQVTTGTLTHNGTDAFGMYIDGVLVQSVCDTDAATGVAALAVEFAKTPLKDYITFLDNEDGTFVLTKKNGGTFSYISYSPAVADIGFVATTPGTPAVRSHVGTIQRIETDGVYVKMSPAA